MLKCMPGCMLISIMGTFIKALSFIQLMDYKDMLNKARDELPDVVFEKERFEIPKVMGHLQGNKTIISNFITIANTLRRPREHMLKYILKALATPGELKNGTLIFGSNIPASKINEKIKQYAHEFVLCRECGKPDTKILKEGQFTFIKCQACGAKYTIKDIK